jgi:hypothetical protein
MEIDEGPSPEEIEKAVRSLKLVLRLVERNPIAAGAKNILESLYGAPLENELEHWLRDPKIDRQGRDEFIKEMVRIWHSSA